MCGRALILTVVVLACAASAAPADAAVVKKGGWRYVTKSYGSTQPRNKTLAARCPDGTHVYSGGHFNTGAFGDLTSQHSYPYDGDDRGTKPDDGWRTRVSIIETLTPSAYAVCAKPMPKYVEQAINASTVLQRQQEALNCPTGTAAISGGTDGPAFLREVESFPGPPFVQWNVAVENYDTAMPSSFRMLVVCSSNLSVSISSDTVAPQQQGFDSAGCLGGDMPYVIGGGEDNDGAAKGDIVVAASRPIDFAGSGPAGWEAWLDNHHASSAIGFDTFAVCGERVN